MHNIDVYVYIYIDHIVYIRGFHSHGGTPIAGWFISWTLPFKKMMTGGTPISGQLHMGGSTNGWYETIGWSMRGKKHHENGG